MYYTHIPPFIAAISLYTKPQHTLCVLCANYTLDTTASSSTDATCAVWRNTKEVNTTYRNSYAFCVHSEQSDLQTLSKQSSGTTGSLKIKTCKVFSDKRNEELDKYLWGKEEDVIKFWTSSWAQTSFLLSAGSQHDARPPSSLRTERAGLGSRVMTHVAVLKEQESL